MEGGANKGKRERADGAWSTGSGPPPGYDPREIDGETETKEQRLRRRLTSWISCDNPDGGHIDLQTPRLAHLNSVFYSFGDLKRIINDGETFLVTNKGHLDHQIPGIKSVILFDYYSLNTRNSRDRI